MIRRLHVVVLVLGVLALAAPLAAWGEPSFTVRDVDGATAFAFDGFVTVAVGGTPTTAPAAATGRFVADGRGNLNDGVRTLVVGGTVLHQTFRCTYVVNSNGTGSADCDVETGPVVTKETFDFVIVERKKTAFFTSTTPGSTIRGATQRQQ
jgi:hypothetical protein